MKDFVPYELSVEVKDLGFNEPCIAVYTKDKTDVKITADPKEHYYYENSAPTYAQVFDWFEKNHGLYVEWLMDGWLDDKCVSETHLCYRVFIWEVGKPKPKPTDDIGAGTKEQMNKSALEILCHIVSEKQALIKKEEA